MPNLHLRRVKLQRLAATESHLEVLEAFGHEMLVQVSDDEVVFSKLLLRHLASRVSVLASNYPSIAGVFQRTEAAVYGLFMRLSLKCLVQATQAPGLL
ncbi:hypothetical protein GRJ2_002227900 [Grus japonensis]|uniref:Uncharacterized protein n=1 Tax=Grus japonensis TaxID=30415 RepID=A0ABC9XKP6_GRUJA